MDLYALFTLISATFTGATLGSFLLTSLLYPALLKHPTNLTDSLYIYRRLYRLNGVLCLLAGVCAALIKNQQAALLLAIIAMSYVFNQAHILRGMQKACDENYQLINLQAYRSIHNLQNLIHLLQFIAPGYALYLLAKSL